MSTTDETLAIARAYSETFNNRDWDGLRAILAPDIISESKSHQSSQTGADPILSARQKNLESHPDRHIEIVNAFASGEWAVAELLAVASDPETGKRMTLPTCHVYQVQNGKIVRVTTYSDATWR
jgi:ketosteroid isomerase-like protein